VLISIAIGFMIFGLLFVISSATSVGGFGYGPTPDQLLGLGVITFAIGLALCTIKTGKRNKEATVA
jgi:hypothetical protein